MINWLTSNILERTCNFKLLEEKCIKYIEKKLIIQLSDYIKYNENIKVKDIKLILNNESICKKTLESCNEDIMNIYIDDNKVDLKIEL